MTGLFLSLPFIHVIATARSSFLFKAKQYSVAWIYHILFIHLSVSEHLGFFHLLAIVIGCCEHTDICMGPCFHPCEYTRSRIAGSYNFIFIILRTCHAVFHSSCTILHSYQQWMRALICLHPFDCVFNQTFNTADSKSRRFKMERIRKRYNTHIEYFRAADSVMSLLEEESGKNPM